MWGCVLMVNNNEEEHVNSEDIAIVGIACRLPNANNSEEFWNNLADGISSIREIPSNRWDINKYYSTDINEPNKSVSKWVGLLDGVDFFDNRFFSISPREAMNMDPQQRLLLEETWHCIEDSGIPLRLLQESKTSVYMSFLNADYRQGLMSEDVETDRYSTIGNFDAFMANRISYTFGFQGASLPINVACASIVTGIHEAKMSLRSGECDYAFVGGVNLNLHPWKYISFSKLRLLSPEGQCKTFDKDANGYVPGDGVGVLLIQRLSDAIRDGNHIYGVIKGTAVNHSGKSLSVSAPSVDAQKAVILEAYRDAGIHPETVNYVEAQGTGTSLGDPIEIESLTRAFREYTDKKQFCKVGVFKTNIGHLEAAAGVAAIIKVLMMMKYRKIPKILNLKQQNPMIDFTNSPFLVAKELSNWESSVPGEPLRAGINSLSFSGVNAHLILEEYKDLPISQVEKEPREQLFVLSAKTRESLSSQVQKWKLYSQSEMFLKENLHNICGTLRTGREPFEYRVGKLVSTHDEIVSFLENATAEIVKETEQLWELRIGHLEWKGLEDVRRLTKQCDLFDKKLKIGLEKYANLLPEQDVRKQFQASVWEEKNREVFSLLVGFAILATLREMGWTPQVIISEKSGLLLGLIASGMVKVEDALAYIIDREAIGNLHFSRPKIPLLNLVSGSLIKPFIFNQDYTRTLVSDGPKGKEIEQLFTIYAERARQLLEVQFSFKKLLEEWDDSVKRVFGQELSMVLRRNNLKLNEKLFLVVIILNALQKLEDKWNLTEQQALIGKNLKELVHLVTDEVLSKEMTVELLLQDEPDFASIAKHLSEYQDRLNLCRPYENLRAGQNYLPEIRDMAKWLEQAASADAPLIGKSVNALEIGKCTMKSSGENCVHVEHLQETLLQLWLKGVSLNWKKIDLEGTYRKVPLPVYHFEQKSFWNYPTAHVNSVVRRSISTEHLKQESQVIMGKIEQKVTAVKQHEDELRKGLEQQKVMESEIDKQIEPVIDYQKLTNLVSEVFAESLGIELHEVGEDTDLREFGMDSVSLTEFSDRINFRLKTNINSSLLFQYTTIREITEYLHVTYPEILQNLFGEQDSNKGVCSDEQSKPISLPINMPVQTSKKVNRTDGGDVAIIGMSCRFPGSKNTRKFWEHLVANHDLITEIPQDRWNWQGFFGDPHEERNKCTVHWGGFLDDIKGFDAKFFKISPKEAELMDPQQRLTLEEAWHAIEDAGYKPSSLSGSQTGVFIGVCNADYRELLVQNGVELNAYTAIGTYFSIIPNRISYHLNLRGPSVAYETACSSSLVAIDEAIHSIQKGECELALAGGVNINSSPNLFISFDSAGMLSRDGRCKTFDSSANGYVRGEGVGIVLLKDKDQAIKDGDYIYGVIKGSAVNHGGYANSLTAPNPNAQADLVATAWENAKLSPETASYIEAHGTGTSLGDPIEINGLKKAFDELYKRSGKTRTRSEYIGIGTAKTTIGHLESASGIAGVIKLLLSMKHGIQTGNIHLKELNPYVRLEDSPFSIVQENREWKRMIDEDGKEIPRRAGVSSFGIGGTNAHIVLEEYEDIRVKERMSEDQEPKVVILSAKNEKSLIEYAKEIKEYLSWYEINKSGLEKVQEIVITIVSDVLQISPEEIDLHDQFDEYGMDMMEVNRVVNRINEYFGENISTDLFIEQLLTIESLSTYLLAEKSSHSIQNKYKESIVLADIAYTMQVGRDEMEERVAFIVSSIKELVEKLTFFVEGSTDDPSIFTGNVKNDKKMLALLLQGTEGDSFMQLVVSKRRIEKIAQLWVMGVSIDWTLLHQDGMQKRVPLPGYPFEKRQYWFSNNVEKAVPVQKNKVLKPVVVSHESTSNQPLLIKGESQTKDSVKTGLSKEEVKKRIASIVESVLHLQQNEIDYEANLKDLGLDSIGGVELIRQVNKVFDLSLEVVVIYDYSNIDSLSELVAERLPNENKNKELVYPKSELNSGDNIQSNKEKITNLLQLLQDEEIDLNEVDLLLGEIL